MKRLLSVFTVIFLLFLSNSYCQTVSGINFVFHDSIIVKNEEDSALHFPWAGGVNAVQFAEMDLNHDEIYDLIIFDRIGNKILPFISTSTFVSSYPDYYDNFIFAPKYADSLPFIENWLICADYNNDGLSDIFTYTIGGIKVYENVSQKGRLLFNQVTEPFLRSYYNEVYTNILATSVDYPGIFDIDNDGDLDVFVFGALGAFVEFHRNISMELYGISDSLVFRKETDCWGNFAESEESNQIFLNTCLGDKDVEKERHTGSTFLFFDADGNGVSDLLLGDVDYASSCLLLNKDNEDALIYDYSFNYPNDEPIHLSSFPVFKLLDFDGDKTNELVVSIFSPDYSKSDGANSVWMYKNNSIDDMPDFSLITKSFLQEEMIDVGTGAFPLLFDYDNDGLTDLFIGNYGYCDSCYYQQGNLKCVYSSSIAFFKNVGNPAKPEFKIVDYDFAHLSSYKLQSLHPAFFDIDNDGDYDLFCGTSSGTIYLFENEGNNFVLKDDDWLNLSSLHAENLAPCFFDINKDGAMDIIIGNSFGTLFFYENVGDVSAPEFSLASDSFGNVDVRDHDYSWTGNSTVSAFRHSDTTYILVGSENGKLSLFSDIDDNIGGTFTEKLVIENNGFRVAPTVDEITDDNFPDIVLGNFSGGVQFFKGVKNIQVGMVDDKINKDFVKVFPNPVTDGKLNVELNFIDENVVFQLFNLINNKVCQHKLNEKSNFLDISGLPDGMYVYRIISSSKIFSGKIIVVNNN